MILNDRNENYLRQRAIEELETTGDNMKAIQLLVLAEIKHRDLQVK